MAKSKKSKPSFDLPAPARRARTAGSAPAAPEGTGWVYKSSADSPVVAFPPREIRSAPVAAAPPSGSRTLLDWITLPFEIAMMVALVPLGSPRRVK
jgi:hypothetical protein